MKEMAVFCLTVLLALSMCACSPAESSTTYAVGEYVVDQENGTISDGTYTYHYTFSGDASGYSAEITYPDGSTYWWSRQTNSNGIGFGGGGWSDDYDPDRYVSGDILCDILEAGAPQANKQASPGEALLGIVLIGGGLVSAIAPQVGWHLSEGWKFKAAEPSEMALGLGRAGGVFAIIIGVIALLGGFSG